MVDFIDQNKNEFGVEPICMERQFAPSTYDAAKARPVSQRAVSDEQTAAKIHDIHASNYGVYGARKWLFGHWVGVMK